MTLGSTQPLTEMSTRNLPGGKGRPELKADNIADCLEDVGAWRLKPLWASTACYRDGFTFFRRICMQYTEYLSN
jgi:hypothetical protein